MRRSKMLFECVLSALVTAVWCVSEVSPGVLLDSDPQPHEETASATLPSPQGVTMQSLNTQYVLKWTWPHGSGGNRTVTFAAQYMPLRSIPTHRKFKLRSRNRSWSTVCENITDTQCDFSDSDLYYFGIYLLRVRASREKENSDWVQQEFCPDKDANLGPPSNVEVTPANNGLTVNISDPLTSKHTSMKDYLAYMYYSVQYWKHSTAERKEYRYLNVTRNVVTLLKLESWTLYCVKVQSRYDFYRKASTFSPQQCVETRGPTALWQILLVFLLSMALCFACILFPSVIVLKAYSLVKRTFFPSCPIPSSLQETFYDSSSSPSSDHPSLLTLESELEICLQKLEISPEVVPLEIHAADEPEGPEGLRHSRQGSGDSGVYSAEDNSGRSNNMQEPGKVAEKRMDVLLNARDVVIHSTPGGHGWNCGVPDLIAKTSQPVLDAGF
ncbi:interferon alpha/beta receptor 1b-like isoform X1 [Scleropages formosus]|uniref:interferon alpha/beta receptor 1b-like isoform X1 n=1 Tax=Scleropages formosus TaxID=113540 RepID=UPI0010FA6E93|nr:interferon alpha/beta receptor 1b-like isoform X1 [Scleropages formosus]